MLCIEGSIVKNPGIEPSHRSASSLGSNTFTIA